MYDNYYTDKLWSKIFQLEKKRVMLIIKKLLNVISLVKTWKC